MILGISILFTYDLNNPLHSTYVLKGNENVYMTIKLGRYYFIGNGEETEYQKSWCGNGVKLNLNEKEQPEAIYSSTQPQYKIFYMDYNEEENSDLIFKLYDNRKLIIYRSDASSFMPEFERVFPF